jgi:hypothetical protein
MKIYTSKSQIPGLKFQGEYPNLDKPEPLGLVFERAQAEVKKVMKNTYH